MTRSETDVDNTPASSSICTVHSFTVCLRVPIAVLKHYDQTQLVSAHSLQPSIQRTESRNSREYEPGSRS